MENLFAIHMQNAESHTWQGFLWSHIWQSPMNSYWWEENVMLNKKSAKSQLHMKKFAPEKKILYECKVWGRKNGTLSEIGHKWKIHNFYPIFTKIGENDYLMKWLFSPSFMKIRQKIWIFWPIFEYVPFFIPQTLDKIMRKRIFEIAHQPFELPPTLVDSYLQRQFSEKHFDISLWPYTRFWNKQYFIWMP